MIQGILFDVDGVIFDSEQFIKQAFYNYFESFYGRTITEKDMAPYVGTGEKTSIEGLCGALGLDCDVERDKKGIYEEYARLIKGKLKCMNGSKRFNENAKKAGLKLALATSADRTKLNSSLTETGLGTEMFDFIVSGDMVSRTKPDGAIYRYAASGLVLENERCLVVEDAVSGHMAAKRAGSPSLGVTSSFGAEDLVLGGADLVLKDLSEFPDFETVQQFNEIYENLLLEFRKKSVIGTLIEKASKVIENAYAPYSKFKVGAAILTANGNIYSGCNVENSSFGGTICAERGAAMTAIANEGRTSFNAIAITSFTKEPAPPCAICRQFLSEFAGPDMQVYLYSVSDGTYRHYNFGTLMPSVFELN